MSKSLFEDELIAGMEKQLRKQASGETPSLSKAADCLHAALEILEAQGMAARADQLLQLLQKIAQTNDARSDVQKMPSLRALMEAGMTQRDLHEFSKGNPIAKAKFNLVLRSLGYSDHQIGSFIGKTNVMSEDDAKAVLDPNRSFSRIYDWMSDPTQPVDPNSPQPGETISMKSLPITGPGDTISMKSMKEPLEPSKNDLTFKSIAKKKDSHTDRLTSEKMLKNLETHGTPFNLADDVPPPLDMNNLKESDFEDGFGELAGLLGNDLGDSEDAFSVDINDTLEVTENDIPMDDFEEERD